MAGTPFGLTVTAEDTYGNQATSFNTSVSIGLSHNPGTGSLGGTLSQPGEQRRGAVLRSHAEHGRNRLHDRGHERPPHFISIEPDQRDAGDSDRLGGLYSPADDHDFRLASLVWPLRHWTQFGNLATGYTGTVTIALENNPGNATLGGPLTATAVGGSRQFPRLHHHRDGRVGLHLEGDRRLGSRQ